MMTETLDIDEAWTADDDYDEFRPMSFTEALHMADTGEDFVIDGLVTTGATLLYGEPNAGKSLMTAGMVASLVTGAPFLGREVYGTRKVAVCWSDDRGPAEYSKRITPLLPDGSTDDVMFYQMPIMRTAEQWQGLYDRVMDDGCDFVVFDVLTQIVDGDINDGPPIAKFFDGVRRFTRNGIPVLVITHSSEKRGPHGQAPNKPMGHTSISGFARWNIYLQKSSKGDWKARCSGKWADAWEVCFKASKFNVPRFEVVGEENGEELRAKSRQRSRDVMNQRADIARYLVDECQGMTKVEAAKRIAEKFGGRANTHQARLSDGTYDALVHFDRGAWTPA